MLRLLTNLSFIWRELMTSFLTAREICPFEELRTRLYPPAEEHPGPNRESKNLIWTFFARIGNSIKLMLQSVFVKSSFVDV